MNIILLPPEELTPEGLARLSGARARHVLEVLRAGPGSTVRAGVVGGRLGMAQVVSGGPAEVVLRLALDGPPPPRPNVDLVLAMPRPKALRRLLPVVASLGVDRLVLIAATRVERSYLESSVLAPETMRRHLLDGLEQAQDTVLPRVSVEPRFRPFVEDRMDALLGPGERWVLHPGAGLLPRPSPDGRLALAIGPEGGWVPFERALLEAHGFRPLAFGVRTLRTETVVPFALGWALR